MAKSAFITRSITGLVFSATLIFAILYSEWSLFILFLFFGIVGMTELEKLSGQKGVNLIGHLGGVGLFGLIALAPILEIDVKPVWLLIPIPLLLIQELFRNGELQSRVGTTLMSWFYVVLPFALLIPLGKLNGGYEPWLVLGYFFILWSNDTGAYLTGSAIGKHKLAASISPGKTWEGFIGGVALSILVSWLLSEYVGILEMRSWIIIGIITSVFGTMGDLVESIMKRRAGIKDSGNLLPGHGGVLDRFDGLLLSLPLVYIYLVLFP